MDFKDLEIYKLARGIEKDAWEIYSDFDREAKHIIGDQFIRSVDSIAANIAEGCGRFHYLDRNKFNYNARGSLSESWHWLDILKERGYISDALHGRISENLKNLEIKLNNYIKAVKMQKEENSDKIAKQ